MIARQKKHVEMESQNKNINNELLVKSVIALAPAWSLDKVPPMTRNDDRKPRRHRTTSTGIFCLSSRRVSARQNKCLLRSLPCVVVVAF